MPASKSEGHPDLFLPNLVRGPNQGVWTVHESPDLLQCKVELQFKDAYVPKPRTRAQRAARMHEMLHVKYSTKESLQKRGKSPQWKALRSKLEEPRVNAIGWTRHSIDTRQAYNGIDWDKIPDPEDPFNATLMWLQLAFPRNGIAGMPDHEVDPRLERLYNLCWAAIEAHPVTFGRMTLANALGQFFKTIVRVPTDETTLRWADTLENFFTPPPPPPPPPPTEEEKEEEAEAIEEEVQIERRREERMDPNVGSPTYDHTYYDIHDHTKFARREQLVIPRKVSPIDYGNVFLYPHRWAIDKAIFARRRRTDGSLMIDGSGSMHWTNDQMAEVLKHAPGLWIARYTSYIDRSKPKLVGRICILAKDGKFARVIPEDGSGGNVLDLEALELLARQPEPRFWLSDGFVCGGMHTGPSQKIGDCQLNYLVWKCNEVMRRANILRIEEQTDALELFAKRPVNLWPTVWGSTVHTLNIYRAYGWLCTSHNPATHIPQPIKVKL